MEELGLPERLFQTGFEPSGRKRINNYFNLRWIEVVKSALSDAQQEMLAESQFRQLMLMGSHTFSVMFAHQLLSRQLVTRKLFELWWLFAGKPIRYSIGDFALVTGLNCGTPPMESVGRQGRGKGLKKKGKSKVKQLGGDGVVWQSLFGSEEAITPDWIICKLGQKDRYKDEDTRLRLSLLLLVEGILCPTSGSTQIRPEVVEMVGDISMFMQYPWGRESFLLTVCSQKIRSAGQLAQDTLAIQGFSHAMVLVTVCCCPQIIAEPRLGEDPVNEDLPIEDIVDAVCSRTVKVNVVTVQNLELIGQASVRSILYEGSDIPPFPEELEDLKVDHMVCLIRDGFPFEINTWRGGVKARDAKQWKGGNGPEGVRAGEGPGENTNTDGTGVNLDVPNLVRCIANELNARAGPVIAAIKTHITVEIVALKDDVLNATKMNAEAEMEGEGGISNTVRQRNADGVQTSAPTFEADTTPFDEVPPSGGVVGESTGAGPRSGCDDTLPSPGANGSGATRQIGAPNNQQVDNVAKPHDVVAGTRVSGGKGSGPTQQTGTRTVSESAGARTISERGTLSSTGHRGAKRGTSDTITTRKNQVDFAEQETSLRDLVKDIVETSGTYETNSNPDAVLGDNTDNQPHVVVETTTGSSMEPTDADGPTKPMEMEVVLPQPTGSEVGATRASKRLRLQPVRFINEPPVEKKGQTKGGAKKKTESRNKKCAAPLLPPSSVSTSSTTSPTKHAATFEIPTICGPLVGGFFPCVRLNAFRLAGFRTVMHTQRDYNLGDGVIVDNSVFLSFFESSQPQSVKAADMVVTFIRRRIRKDGIKSYDFMPASFANSLRAEHQQFSRVQDIGKFSFSSIFADPSFPNMRWTSEVEVLYCPFQVDGRHWIGVVIDISEWRIFVLDCNPACVQEDKLEALLTPFVVLMPLLIRHNGGKSHTEASMETRMSITRLDLPFCCEQTGLSCVATHLLLEMHATDNIAHVGNLTEESVAVAAQTYAVEAFAAFNPDDLKEFPNYS